MAGISGRVATIAAVVLVTGCAPAGAAPDLHSPGRLTVCSYAHFTPVSYGDGQGYEADLIRAVARRWGVQPVFVPIDDFDGIWLAPLNPALGCDAAIGGITPTDERRRQGAVFGPVTTRFAQSLLVRTEDYDAGRVTGYPSFAGTSMVIGVVPGTTGESFARLRAAEAGLPGSVLREYPGEDQLLPALTSGEIDAIARGEIGNRYQQSLDPALITIDLRDFGEGFAMAIDPANPQLLDALSEALDVVTDGGLLDYRSWAADPLVFAGRP